MKIRLTLKAVKDFGTIKKDEELILFNDVFCEKTGIAYYPIDSNQWSVLHYDLNIDVKDESGKDIHNRDHVEVIFNPEDGGNSACGHIVFDQGSFCVHIEKIYDNIKGSGYDVGQMIPLYKFHSINIIQ